MTSVSAKGDTWRVEEDALGEVRVPAEHLWGAQTERSRQNFTIGVERRRWSRPVIRAFGLLKNPSPAEARLLATETELISCRLEGSGRYIFLITRLRQLGFCERT